MLKKKDAIAATTGLAQLAQQDFPEWRAEGGVVWWVNAAHQYLRVGDGRDGTKYWAVLSCSTKPNACVAAVGWSSGEFPRGVYGPRGGSWAKIHRAGSAIELEYPAFIVSAQALSMERGEAGGYPLLSIAGVRDCWGSISRDLTEFGLPYLELARSFRSRRLTID